MECKNDTDWIKLSVNDGGRRNYKEGLLQTLVKMMWIVSLLPWDNMMHFDTSCQTLHRLVCGWQNVWATKKWLIVLVLGMSEVLWHYWLGIRNSILPIKNWVMWCWCGCLSAAKCKWFAYGPADATAIHNLFIKIQNGSAYLLLVYPGCSGKEAIKWV